MTHKRNSIAGAMTAIALVAGPAAAQEPYSKADDSWISISGTVAAPTADSFMLDYGDGVITVEMDDWDTYGDAYGLLDGDKVTVYGKIDDDLYDMRTIEAGSVYVENLNTYFYASASDEEDAWTTPWTLTAPVVVAQTTMRGTVSETSPDEGEFTLEVGSVEVDVETERLSYDPLDDTGYQQVGIGDRVSVTGQLDSDYLEGQVFDAELITTLEDADDDTG
ncbi:hypothetical protein [Marivita sp.]|uniref:hypothetical protein n=1 Tax=Marivita sp. TaxID=2003365 RepID=UPI0025BF4064|nr:hypothetical protein [Marivita sp.]